MEYVLTFVLGAIFAGVFVYLLNRSRISDLKSDVKQKETELSQLRDQNISLKAELSGISTKLAEQQKAAEEKISLLNEAKEKLTDAFKALSAEALQSNNAQFLELAKTNLETFQVEAKADLEMRQTAINELVKPLGQSLKDYNDKIADIEKDRVGAYSGLTNQVGSMAKEEEKLRAETAKLVTALRRPDVRGRWGEIQLKRVVEIAGMVEHCDFVVQTISMLEGDRTRPDMIINLPNKRNVVIDSKVPLQAYLDAIEAQDDATRNAKLREHATHIRMHISNLSAKSYWEQFQPAPEFVILFLPGEMFFDAAVQQDSGLFEFGIERRVILATPTNLIALLLTVAHGWRQEQIAKNTQKISELGKTLYDRICTLTEHFSDIQKGLEHSVEAYNKAVGSLEGRVLVTARKFKELGATAGDDIEMLEPIDKTTRSIQGSDFSFVDNKDNKQNTENLT